MCFVHAWWVGFLVNDIAPWLLHRITIIFFSSMYLKSIINFVIHMASFVACVFAMYSASMVDNAIVGCRLLLQEMAPPLIMKTNHVVDLYLQDHHPNPHRNIQELPWMLLHQIVISFAMYLANIERFVWRPSMLHVRVRHVLTQHPYWVCQVGSCAQHGIHQRPSRLLIWKSLWFIVATLTWPSVGVKPNTWKSWGFGVLRDSRTFRARH